MGSPPHPWCNASPLNEYPNPVFWLIALNPMQWFQELYEVCTQWMQEPYAIWALFGVSFAGSSVFPIPADPLLLLWGAVETNRDQVLVVALLTGLCSCAGGLVGYGIGYVGGRPLLAWMGRKRWLHWLMNPQRQAAVEQGFRRWGAWAIVVAALTPIPYKLFAISAGAARMNLRPFVLGSLAGRMPRFLAEGLALYYLGPYVQQEFSARGEIWFSILGVVVLLGFCMVARWKPKAPATDVAVSPPTADDLQTGRAEVAIPVAEPPVSA